LAFWLIRSITSPFGTVPSLVIYQGGVDDFGSVGHNIVFVPNDRLRSALAGTTLKFNGIGIEVSEVMDDYSFSRDHWAVLSFEMRSEYKAMQGHDRRQKISLAIIVVCAGFVAGFIRDANATSKFDLYTAYIVLESLVHGAEADNCQNVPDATGYRAIGLRFKPTLHAFQ
jgi:hypothetical protein